MIKSEHDFYATHFGPERVNELIEHESIMLEFLASLQTTGKKLLDVGCGAGVFLQKAQARFPGLSCEGVDGSPDQISRCQAKGVRATYADLRDGIPAESQSYDIVHCCEVIEHVYDPDFLIDEMHRVLKPKGHLILSTPNLHAWYNRILFMFGIMPIFMEVSTRDSALGFGVLKRLKRGHNPVGHIRLMNLEALGDLLKRRGFRVQQVRSASFAALPRFLRVLERLLFFRPSFCSILVVLATRD